MPYCQKITPFQKTNHFQKNTYFEKIAPIFKITHFQSFNLGFKILTQVQIVKSWLFLSFFFNIFTMLIHFYLFSSIFVYFGRFLSICNRFHPFPPHYRFLHDQVWRNGLPTLLKSLIRTVWAYSESQTAQILDWGYLRKNSFFCAKWPNNHFPVAESGFWGDFSQVLGG